MNIVIMGPPGAGKGTQASLIVHELGIPHISTGDAFRLAIQKETPVGIKAKHYIDKGLLVPDSITIGIVQERLAQSDCRKGFLLDGFPRTLSQGKALEHLLKQFETTVTHVINLQVEREQLIARITGRRLCPVCGASYHIMYHPPLQEGICDKDQAQLIQRSDDNEKSVSIRLDEYFNKTLPLLEFYKHKNLLWQIDGQQPISAISHQIVSLLRG